MYEDIIHLSRPVSKFKTASKMERAVQFAPFAALKGYEVCIENETRQVESKRILCEDQKMELNDVFFQLKKGDRICFDFFEADEYKVGGQYKKIEGIVQQVDEINLMIQLKNGLVFSMDCIYSLKIIESI